MCDLSVSRVTVHARDRRSGGAQRLPLRHDGLRAPPRRHPARRARPRGLALGRCRQRARRARAPGRRRPLGRPSPASWCPSDAELVVEAGPEFVSRGGVKLANASRVRGPRRRGRGRRARLPRRRRLDRRLHRLPARARRRPGDRARRRLRAARLDASPGRPGDGDGAGQRPRPRPTASCPSSPGLVTIDVSFISLAMLLGPIAAVAGRRPRPAGAWSSRSSSSAPSGSGAAGWSARPPTAATRSARSPRRGSARAWSSAGSPPRACPGPKGNRETFICFARSGDAADLDAALERVEPS